MAVLSTGIGDLVTTALNNVEKLRFTDISQPLQKLLALNVMTKKNKVIFDSGVDFRFDLMTDYNHGAKSQGLYYQIKVGVPDVMQQAIIPWRHVGWNWAIERREIAMNRSPVKIVDIALTRRLASFVGAAVYLEGVLWGQPAVTDTVTPYGIPSWIVKNATTGFNGGVPSGWTSIGNINPTLYPNFQNWTFQYIYPTVDDLMQKWYQAAEFTEFETAVPNMPTFDSGDEYAFYTNWAVLGPVRQILRVSNDDLGSDLENYGGSRTLFMQKELIRVPQLEADTTGPIYGINWGVFKFAGLRGEWLHETPIPIMPNQPTVAARVTDLTIQPFTYDRRRHFVGATSTSMPGI